ncbi:MAG: cysteine synthase, partial [Thermoproteota archaeon]|nr:cysteine synthase [Thermoproteota archaeon]
MTEENDIDNALLEKFEKEILSQVPHRKENDGKVEIVNPTPLTDLTDDLKECAKTVYDVDLDEKDFKIYGKFDCT